MIKSIILIVIGMFMGMATMSAMIMSREDEELEDEWLQRWLDEE